MQQVSTLVRCALVIAFVSCSASALADALTDRAKRLLEQRQPKQAYDLLLPQESARAGDPEFDYLLGIAAIDAGAPERGVFALERVLAVQPNNHLARAEIARAYLALGERDAARREFQAVRSQPIPESAKATIDRFLSAMAAAEVTKVTGYLELGAGYDSNVNSATSNSQIALPGLGIIATLTPGSTGQSDTFTSLAGGVNVTHRLSPQWALLGGVAAAAKLNTDEKQFDTLNLEGNIGARYTVGKEAFIAGAQFQNFELDWERYRVMQGVVAQWQHSYDERRQATVYGQFSNLHYPTETIRDADRGVLGVAYGRAFSGDYSPVVFGSAYLGTEREEADGVPHLGHDLAGLRFGGQLRLTTGWALLGTLAFEHRKYGGPEPLFGETREDNQADVSVGVSYVIRPGTTLIAQAAYTNHDSNIAINDFDRTVGSVSLRFNF